MSDFSPLNIYLLKPGTLSSSVNVTPCFISQVPGMWVLSLVSIRLFCCCVEDLGLSPCITLSTWKSIITRTYVLMAWPVDWQTFHSLSRHTPDSDWPISTCFSHHSSNMMLLFWQNESLPPLAPAAEWTGVFNDSYICEFNRHFLRVTTALPALCWAHTYKLCDTHVQT